MNDAAVPAFHVIRTDDALRWFASMIRKEKMLAVDLEADSMFHYQEKVCLIQMAGKDITAVADPLAVPDLSPLAPIFADTAVCKIFHGADYDVRSLYRDFSIEVHNLFDTQLASMFLGETATSLEAVVGQRFGVQLDKRYQKKDWSQRPLPDEMIAYAASDVVYLVPLAQMLMTELEALGRLEWVREECLYLSGVRSVENGTGLEILRFRGAGRLPRRNLAVLEDLLKYRRSLAMQKDRPLFKVFSNASMLKIATEMIDTPSSMVESGALSSRQVRVYGNVLSEIVRKARSMPESQLPRYPKKPKPMLSPEVPERVRVIKAWRDDVAADLRLDPALLFNRALLTAIAIRRPADMAALEKIDGIRHWQVKTFGKAVLAALHTVA
ncbi:HRDC domain-containing protein [Desulfosarcina sp. OttesenSCG-928-A07]|nr:HRDC domain-containing protein [Desulfosarcina sp. OttesenSCG-928-G17]MDL2328697.1 HRDC domain-containing protein [Desulfosarcina sp. OttesenSCG-928-A07]